ncbi:MAG: GNAT family N-acetyltransferase [Pseudomonadota bacterium]
MDEQGVPESLEVDDRDGEAWHLLARGAAGLPVGCARLLPDAHIGRLAVLRSVRGHGVGRQLLDAAVQLGRRLRMGDLYLHAQVRARGFYEAAGFIAEGDEFTEAGIAHVLMRLPAAEGETNSRCPPRVGLATAAARGSGARAANPYGNEDSARGGPPAKQGV